MENEVGKREKRVRGEEKVAITHTCTSIICFIWLVCYKHTFHVHVHVLYIQCTCTWI